MEKTAQRIDSIDILRGLMAMSVAVYHMSHWSQLFVTGSLPDNLTAILGHYGVEGFFVVSGFCFFFLYRNTVWNRQELAAFHIKRFLRIAPLYYFAVLLNLALGLHVGPTKFSWIYFTENMTLTFGFFHPNHAMVLGGWSIGVEYVFYVFFPLLSLLSRSTLRLAIMLIIGLSLAYPFTFGAVQSAPYADKFHVYVQIRNHAFLFLFGAAIARLHSATTFRFTTSRFLLLFTLLLIAALPLGAPFFDHFDIMAGLFRVRYVLLCLGMVTLFALYEVPPTPLRTCLIFLGNVSYSVYLLHPFAYKVVVRRYLPADLPSFVKFGIGLTLTLLLSSLAFRFLEKPAIRLGRKWAAKIL